MGGWGSEPGMIQEPELEEGETSCYKDDTTIDPDIALSYIGDKVQSILGHLQKDFEGVVVSAENLGAKFGGYGSFLPTYQRSPSIWTQPKSPQKVQKPNLLKSPNHLCSEGPTPNSSQSLKTSYEDASIRQKITLSSDKPPNQRTLKVRIKVGPDRAAQYNAEIYNLGLTSPSSSEGDSHDESDGLPFESHENHEETPLHILQIMTSFPVSGGLLLSPLCEDLLSLARETEYLVENEHEAAPKSSSMSIGPLKNEVSVGKKAKSVGKSRSFEKSEDFTLERNDCEQKTMVTDNQEQPFRDSNCKPLSDKVRESKKKVQVKKKGGIKDRVKERAVSCDSVKESSEGEGVKKAMNNSTLKVGQNATFSEHNSFGNPHDVTRPSFEGEKKSKGSQSSGMKDVQRLQLSQKDVHISSELLENPKRSVEKKKNFKVDTVKARSEKQKERSSNKKYFDKVSSDMHISEPPQPTAIHSKERIFNGLEQPVVAPVLIQEDWVGCDRCQKWRLLPYGTKSEQLPDKWVCSMLNWLPGMNHCDISEDETTKALQALYLAPVPENQHNLQAHGDAAMPGVISAGAHNFSQNQQKSASDQMKKQKLKKQNTVSVSDSVPSNGKKQLLQRAAIKDGSSKEVEQSPAGANAPNKPEIVLEKLNKRKGEHVIGDDANPRKKIKKESDHHMHAKVKKIKSKDVDNLQPSVGNLPMIGQTLTSNLLNKVSVKDGKKKSAQKDAIEVGNFQVHMKKQKDQMQDLPDNRLVSMKTCNSREVAKQKIKSNDYEDSLYQVESQKDVDESGDFHRHKKSRVSQIEEKEFKRSQGDDTSKGKSSGARIQSSVGREHLINRGTEKEQKKSRSKPQLTIEDIDKLRKDLGCEPLSTAATSSSSKVSDSRKIRISYKEAKASPEESVSSSPIRMPLMKFQNMNESSELGNGSEILGSKIKFREETDVERKNHREPKLEVSSNTRHCFSDGSSLKSVKKGTNFGKKDPGKSAKGVQIPAQIEPWNGKLRIDLRQGDKQGSLKRSSMDSRLVDASVVGDTSKAVKESVNNEAEQSMALDSSFGNKNVSGVAAPTALKEAEDVLKEAEELRNHANLIKNSGFTSESNYGYFKAGLKFLQGASLLEACSAESSKHLEMSPMQMYSAAAKLCKTCANEYEKGHEMAVSALAYKCVEVAYMRVVYCKSSTTNRVWHDLQSSLQMVPQGESPSSSASDLDNLNNLATTDKVNLAKPSASHGGNHVIVPRNRPNLVRLLDFAKDVNSAMEAAKKSQDMFASAHVELEKSQNKEAIASVKKVIDFSFQSIEELVRLVWIAFNTVNHGSRE